MTKTDLRAPAQAAATATALRLLLGKLSRRLRTEAAPNELTSSQRVALAHLDREGPLTISGLARVEGVRPQSMSATVGVLEAQGYLRGAPDPQDGRQIFYALTPMATEWLRTERAAREDWLIRALHTKLSASERDELARVLPLIARLAD